MRCVPSWVSRNISLFLACFIFLKDRSTILVAGRVLNNWILKAISESSAATPIAKPLSVFSKSYHRKVKSTVIPMALFLFLLAPIFRLHFCIRAARAAIIIVWLPHNQVSQEALLTYLSQTAISPPLLQKAHMWPLFLHWGFTLWSNFTKHTKSESMLTTAVGEWREGATNIAKELGGNRNSLGQRINSKPSSQSIHLATIIHTLGDWTRLI